MTLTTYHTLKKTFLYNFYPVKEDEERSAPIPTAFGLRLQRALVEIRDVHPPPELDPHHPWLIRKTLNPYEVASGKIVVSFSDTFEHILRYWTLCMANHVTMWGRKIAVVLWDVTDEQNPRKYEGNHIYFQMTPSEHCLLMCAPMMKDRRLKADDNIGLYWEPKLSFFRIKLFSATGR